MSSAARPHPKFQQLLSIPTRTSFRRRAICRAPFAILRGHGPAQRRETVGEIARCTFESLSLNYRSVLESLRALTGRDLRTIRVVGGGGLNTMLCQMTADACGCEVVSGPAEASALGNVMMQAVATGHLADVACRTRGDCGFCAMFPVLAPRGADRWDEALCAILAH